MGIIVIRSEGLNICQVMNSLFVGHYMGFNVGMGFNVCMGFNMCMGFNVCMGINMYMGFSVCIGVKCVDEV